jgi:hypothetical protein
MMRQQPNQFGAAVAAEADDAGARLGIIIHSSE